MCNNSNEMCVQTLASWVEEKAMKCGNKTDMGAEGPLQDPSRKTAFQAIIWLLRWDVGCSSLRQPAAVAYAPNLNFTIIVLNHVTNTDYVDTASVTTKERAQWGASRKNANKIRNPWTDSSFFTVKQTEQRITKCFQKPWIVLFLQR